MGSAASKVALLSARFKHILNFIPFCISFYIIKTRLIYTIWDCFNIAQQ